MIHSNRSHFEWFCPVTIKNWKGHEEVMKIQNRLVCLDCNRQAVFCLGQCVVFYLCAVTGRLHHYSRTRSLFLSRTLAQFLFYHPKHYKWCFNKWPRQQWGRFKLNSVLSQAKEASRLRPGHLKMSLWLDRTFSNRQRVSARHNSIAFRHKVIGPFLLWMCCVSGWERVPGD